MWPEGWGGVNRACASVRTMHRSQIARPPLAPLLALALAGGCDGFPVRDGECWVGQAGLGGPEVLMRDGPWVERAAVRKRSSTVGSGDAPPPMLAVPIETLGEPQLRWLTVEGPYSQSGCGAGQTLGGQPAYLCQRPIRGSEAWLRASFSPEVSGVSEERLDKLEARIRTSVLCDPSSVAKPRG
jgi:hypothetical protein